METSKSVSEYRDKTFSDVYHEKLEESAPTCSGDACDVFSTPRNDDTKLRDWLDRMGPIDYDAPGSTVRETGV